MKIISSILVQAILLVMVTLAGCGSNEISEPIEYKGPLSEAEDVEMYHSENERIKIKMVAPAIAEFQNGDREFPKGIYMEFYDEFGALTSTLKADHAYFFKEEDQWRGRGNVEVKNVQKNEQLNTEELFWKQSERIIFTEKFVTIRQGTEVIYGEGLTANEDLSDYVILDPQAEFEIED